MLDKEKVPAVALDAMNEVHYQEVELLNEILNQLDAVGAGKLAPAALDAPLERLLAHMRAHFAGEEERMVESGFPPYPEHKAEHDRALAQAHSIYDAWQRDRDPKALVAYLERSLPAWMLHHIATMDAATARFLAANGREYVNAS